MWEIHGNPRVVDGFPKETWVFHIYMFWLVVSTPLKNMKVSWDDEIPNIWKNNPNVPNHQPMLL
jgi:hypothetical protein